MTEYFAEQDEALQETETSAGQRLGTEQAASTAGGGRTLGGEPVSATSSAAPQAPSSSRRTAPKKKFATLGDFATASAGDTSSDDGSEDQDFFAGGEKSGLAVQNPDDLKRKILEKARR